MTYSVNDIVGKTLVAKKRVPIKALPQDNAPIIRYVEPNNIVGVVWSYLEPKEGRSQLYWMFEQDFFGQLTYYYVPHSQGLFDKDILVSQMPKPPATILDTVTNIAMGGMGIWAGVQVIRALFGDK